MVHRMGLNRMMTHQGLHSLSALPQLCLTARASKATAKAEGRAETRCSELRLSHAGQQLAQVNSMKLEIDQVRQERTSQSSTEHSRAQQDTAGHSRAQQSKAGAGEG